MIGPNEKYARIEAQVKAMIAICSAVEETVRECGAQGAPGGVLYAALMTRGCTLEQFETIMGALVRSGKIQKHGDCYFRG